ncbi:MAG: ferritin family protein [Chitinivibrionales bacterium]|nr:ferritin family protein [Chitinivibrionales bacterium]
MVVDSIADLLHFAISKEQASRRFYLDMAQRMEDTAVQTIFEAIAVQEQKHEDALKLEVLKQGLTLAPDKGEPAPSAAYDWQKPLMIDADAAAMNYMDALATAIEKERASFQLYTQMIGMTQDMDLRKMLLELAEEEMRHVIQFEREYDAVSHS